MIYYSKPTTQIPLRKITGFSRKFKNRFIAITAIMLFSLNVKAQDVTPPVLRNPNIGCSSINLPDQNECLGQATTFNAHSLESAVAALYMDANGRVTATLIQTTEGPYHTSCAWSFIYTFKISDASNNFVTCEVNRNGADYTIPTFTAPSDVILYLDANCYADDTPSGPAGDVTNESDSCTTGTQMQATYEDGIIRAATCGSYTIMRTWHLYDSCGNPAPDRVQVITVLDTIKPVFTQVPRNITATCCDPITYLVEASDNCSGSADLTYTFTGATTGSGNGSGSGSVFKNGITHVTVIATDGCGNSRSITFNVFVTRLSCKPWP
jgi:hypothetical protein